MRAAHENNFSLSLLMELRIYCRVFGVRRIFVCLFHGLVTGVAIMNHEDALDTMMEERDQLRAAVATSKSLNNFNCSTIIPTKLPIDAAGVSVTPGDATNPSVDVVGAFDVLARHASLCARNLASEVSSRKFRSAIFYSPTVLGSVSDNSEPKAVRFSDVQNFFAGKQNA